MANAAKHTPGPWKVKVISLGTDYLIRFETATLARVFNSPADARLIAAAPDLLSAGKHLFVKLADVYRAAGQNPETCQAIREFMAAVAKVEGRS